MSITVTKNGTDITSQVVFPTLSVEQNLTNEIDNASFDIQAIDYDLLKEDGGFLLQENGYKIRLFSDPAFNDDIVIADGASTIFAGKIGKVQRKIDSPRNFTFTVTCLEHSFQMDRILVSRTYTNKTITYIINDIISSYAPGFTNVNAVSSFTITKIVFNHVSISECLRRLANIVRYDWYVDENKDVHFFPNTLNVAPFSLDDTSGTHVFKSLVRNADGAQTVNSVKVRGGDYDGTLYTDVITVKGNVTSSFTLPYKMANLAISVDTGSGYVSKTVGIDFIDTFPSYDVLYSYQTQSFRFNSPLADGNKIQFSGNPKTPVVAVVQDPTGVAKYGQIEKFISDETILSNKTARKRAAAELLAYSDVAVDARFTTYSSGLRTGMSLNINTSGLQDTLVVKRVAFRARTPLIFEYDVTCISQQRYSLIDLLRKIITLDPSPTDEQETSETLYPASDMFSIADTAKVVTPANNPPAILNFVDLVRNGSGGNTFSLDATGASAIIIAAPSCLNVTGIDFNGSAFVQDGSVGSTFGTSIWRLNNPTSGVHTITVSGASAAIQARAFAVSNLNTADILEGSAFDTSQNQDIKLTVTQANLNTWSIGFMVRINVDAGAPARSYAPDYDETEDADAQVLTNSQMYQIMHKVFTRRGTKKMGSTYSTLFPTSFDHASLVLYNGLSTL